MNIVALKDCTTFGGGNLHQRSFQNKSFANETITKGIQWKEFGIGGIAQLHLEELHTRIWHEIMYLIPYFILYEM